MVAYSFHPRFVDPIREGTKRQTIRAIGSRRHAHHGDPLQLYTGMRTKRCKLILATVCEGQQRILIDWRVRHYKVEGEETRKLGNLFAMADGFDSIDQMQDFWAKYHPGINVFNGVIILW